MTESGNPSLEKRLFLMASAISVFVSFILVIVDTFIAHAYVSSVVGVFSMATSSFMYYQGRYKGRAEAMTTPYLILLLILMNVAWFTGGGLNITNTFIYFLILILTVILLPRTIRTFFIVVVFINLTVFTALEFLYPAYSHPIIKNNEQLVINTIVLLMVFAIGAFILLFFKNQYDRERDTVRLQMAELDTKNMEIRTQNEELVQYQEEVMSQRDFIEEKNKMLQEQAIELEIANNEIQSVNASLERTVEERTKKLLATNSDLDMLVYRSSHDFRRPLTTLMGLHEIARLTIKDELSQELFAKVQSTALNMDKMLLKFFMLYNINHYRNIYESISLQQIIDKIDKNLIARKKNIAFTSQIGISRYTMNDERNSLIEIILENLVENALIYNAKEHIEVDIAIRESNGMLHIIVRDNGNGIPESYHEKVFEIYFRGSVLSSGNGLGLYVVKRVAEILGATIKVDSELGIYSTFTVSFPI